jgi:catalase
VRNRDGDPKQQDAAGGEPLGETGDAVHWIAEAYKHGKTVGALADGDADAFAAAFADAVGRHRHFDRAAALVPA